MDIQLLRHLIQDGNIKWSNHCLERMQERDIYIAEVKEVLRSGEMIEDYPDDFPHPSGLIYGCTKDGRILHVVAGVGEDTVFVITAYVPNKIKFEDDLRTRRRQ